MLAVDALPFARHHKRADAPAMAAGLPDRETWKLVCDGRRFWHGRFATPRKCTQSAVAFNADRTLVRKQFRADAAPAFAAEQRALAALGESSSGAAGGGFPRVVAADGAARVLVTRHAGRPIMPRTVPLACREQVAAITSALAAARVLHGDIVPHNFLRDASGAITLIDFGRASVVGQRRQRSGDGGDSDTRGGGDGGARRRRSGGRRGHAEDVSFDAQARAFERVADQLCDPRRLGE